MARNQNQQAAGGRGLSLTPIWLSLIVALLFIVSFSSVILLFFGMMPSVVAYIIDRTPQRYTTVSVASLNFCGVFPYMLDFWAGPTDFAAMVAILTDVFALLTMYSAAAIGWVVFAGIPPVISSFLTVMSQRRVAQLRSEQRDLIDEWGEGIVAAPEVVSVKQQFGGAAPDDQGLVEHSEIGSQPPSEAPPGPGGSPAPEE